MADLDTCSNEPIKFMEQIQDCGALLVVDGGRRIVQAAVGSSLDFTAQQVLGEVVDTVLPGVARAVWGALKDKTEVTVPLLVKDFKQWITCIAHRVDDLTVFELERVISSSGEIPSVKFKTDRTDSIESYLSYAVENVQSITGFDRVMVYRFAPDWHGEVVAEALALKSTADSFMHHHFPASDIPPPARELFTKNWVRMIANVQSSTVPIISLTGFDHKVDLSRSALRAASPIHIEYLKNMQVESTLTMSLICDGKLWGLIACHNYSPKYVAAQNRAVLALIAKLISAKITNLANVRVEASMAQAGHFIQSLIGNVRGQATSLTNTVRDHKSSIRRMIACDGFSYVNGDEIVTSGVAPSRESVFALRRYLQEEHRKTGKSIIVNDAVGRADENLALMAGTAAGIIAMRLNEQWFVWNRQEQVRAITWAGDPDSKAIYKDGGNLRMSPRLSFQSWQQQVKGQSESWLQEDIDAVEKLQASLLAIFVKHHALEDHSSKEHGPALVQSLKQSAHHDAAALKRDYQLSEVSEISEMFEMDRRA